MSAYATQLDQSGSGRERCAGACLASVLLSRGWESDPFELMRVISDQAGWTDKGASSEQIIAKAAEYNLDGHVWVNWNEAIDALAQGQFVLVLNMNAALVPRAYPSGVGWNAEHWIRLVQVVDGGEYCYCYDPLTYLPQPYGPTYQGPTIYTTESVRAAIRATPNYEAGVILNERQ